MNDGLASAAQLAPAGAAEGSRKVATSSDLRVGPIEPSRSGWYASHGLKLRYVEWGDEGAPPLILVHGGYDHARSWDRIASALADRYRVIVPDARGHGDSDWSGDGNYALLDHVEDQVCLFHHLGLPSAAVIGHSYGGRVTLRHAGIYPEKIDRLVVIEGLGPSRAQRAQWRATPAGHRIREYNDRKRLLAAKPERRFTNLDACAERLTMRNPRLHVDLARHLALHGTRVDAEGLYRWKFDPRVGLPQPVDITFDEELQLFESIALPTLLIHGGESASAAPEGDERVEAMPDSRTLWVPGAGHWVHHDSPDVVLSALAGFLR